MNQTHQLRTPKLIISKAQWVSRSERILTLYTLVSPGVIRHSCKKINEEIIHMIFSHDKKVIPLVAGLNWGYDLKPVKENPIEIEGIGYVAHPYPQKTTAPFEENWEKDFGFVADKYPLFATELGFMAAEDPD